MNDIILYWLYLEPYTFIFKGQDYWVVYNTINSAYLSYKDDFIIDMLKKLSDPDNGYIIPVNKNLARKKNVVDFVRNIRNSFMGDIISDKYIINNGKPFIFMPILRLYNNVDRIKKERGKSLGEVILRNLSEVTFFLPTKCIYSCKYCNLYNQQFIHCSKFLSKNPLSINEYIELFHHLETSGSNKVNFILSGFPDEKVEILLKKCLSFSFKKEFYIDIQNLDDHTWNLLADSNVVIHVTFSFLNVSMGIIVEKVTKYKDYPIYWECVVSNEDDLVYFYKFSFLENLKIIPFYTGNNLSFFEQYVYLSLEDIICRPIEKRQIFRRQALNENFFGKLYILPSGDAYTNMNLPSIGNVKQNPLGEIVYREFDNSQSWLKVRDGKICGNCGNRYLCPSISNYELVMKKENLCHIYMDQNEK